MAASLNKDRAENHAVLRINISDNPTVNEMLNRIRRTHVDALKHDLPFSKLVQQLCPNPDSSYQALCQIAFSPETEGGTKQLDAKFDLHFQVADTSSIALKVRYAKDLFEAETIRRLLAQWETVLGEILEHPNRRLSELRILPSEEQRLLLLGWNNTRREYPREKTLFDLFEEQAMRTPDAVALVCGNNRLTYAQLLARAQAVAAQLRTLGIGRESLVGICLDRCWEMMAGILGTLKAGGAYVPMDPAYPKDRIAFMLSDAKAGVLLTQRKQLSSLPKTDAQIICLDEFDWDASNRECATHVELPASNERQQFAIGLRHLHLRFHWHAQRRRY